MQQKQPQPPSPKPPSANVLSASIAGTGSYLPKRVLTNADLEKMVETTDEWILTRTGIRERRIAAEGETTSDMATEAARQALSNAGVKAGEVDLILVATCTPDHVFPSTACLVQHKLGATHAAALDVSAACSGFLYALITGAQFIASGVYKTVLVIGAEKISSIVDWKDRNTCVLFGDGAGAVVLRHQPGKPGILACDLGSDGGQTDILAIPAGGCALPLTPELLAERQNCIRMTGKEVYKNAVNAMNRSAEICLEKAGLKAADLTKVVPHQANLRIIQSLVQKLELPMEKCFINLDRYGNTSAACIPIGLNEMNSKGQLHKGDKLLLVAFGGGLTWASVALEW